MDHTLDTSSGFNNKIFNTDPATLPATVGAPPVFDDTNYDIFQNLNVDQRSVAGNSGVVTEFEQPSITELVNTMATDHQHKVAADVIAVHQQTATADVIAVHQQTVAAVPQQLPADVIAAVPQQTAVVMAVKGPAHHLPPVTPIAASPAHQLPPAAMARVHQEKAVMGPARQQSPAAMAAATAAMAHARQQSAAAVGPARQMMVGFAEMTVGGPAEPMAVDEPGNLVMQGSGGAAVPTGARSRIVIVIDSSDDEDMPDRDLVLDNALVNSGRASPRHDTASSPTAMEVDLPNVVPPAGVRPVEKPATSSPAHIPEANGVAVKGLQDATIDKLLAAITKPGTRTLVVIQPAFLHDAAIAQMVGKYLHAAVVFKSGGTGLSIARQLLTTVPEFNVRLYMDKGRLDLSCEKQCGAVDVITVKDFVHNVARAKKYDLTSVIAAGMTNDNLRAVVHVRDGAKTVIWTTAGKSPLEGQEGVATIRLTVGNLVPEMVPGVRTFKAFDHVSANALGCASTPELFARLVDDRTEAFETRTKQCFKKGTLAGQRKLDKGCHYGIVIRVATLEQAKISKKQLLDHFHPLRVNIVNGDEENKDNMMKFCDHELDVIILSNQVKKFGLECARPFILLPVDALSLLQTVQFMTRSCSTSAKNFVLVADVLDEAVAFTQRYARYISRGPASVHWE